MIFNLPNSKRPISKPFQTPFLSSSTEIKLQAVIYHNFDLDCSFDWNSKVPIPVEDTNTVNFVAKCSGKAHAILMWWTLDMDMAGEIVLSCAPPWAHPEGVTIVEIWLTRG